MLNALIVKKIILTLFFVPLLLKTGRADIVEPKNENKAFKVLKDFGGFTSDECQIISKSIKKKQNIEKYKKRFFEHFSKVRVPFVIEQINQIRTWDAIIVTIVTGKDVFEILELDEILYPTNIDYDQIAEN
jgi:hypothetical protein